MTFNVDPSKTIHDIAKGLTGSDISMKVINSFTHITCNFLKFNVCLLYQLSLSMPHI